MNGSRRIPHPIPYQGSKRHLAPVILRYFPKHFERLIEPFTGSAAISIAVAERRMAKRFWINDAHAPLMALWQEILHDPDKLIEEYSFLWHDQRGREREYFDMVRARFNESHAAADLLYLLARCVKAVIRYNSEGQFNNTPDNRRCGAKPMEMKQRIIGAAQLLAGRTRITAWDYKKILANCTSRDVIYMDPPYQGVCGNRDQRYASTIDHSEFCHELDQLNRRKCRFLVSYDGRLGDKTYGEPLPARLKLKHLEIRAGRSSQATLLGENHVTYESLYLSPALVKEVDRKDNRQPCQLVLSGDFCGGEEAEVAS